MKKNIFSIKIITLIIVLFFSYTSCTDLDEEVFDKIIAEEFGDYDTDPIVSIGQSYVGLRAVLFGWTCLFDCQEECSDIIVTPVRPNGWDDDGGIYREWHQHYWSPTTVRHSSTLWSVVYNGVNFTNRSLYQIESGSLELGDVKDATVAELKVLRALYYWFLCDNFGNVPLATRWDVPEDEIIPQVSRQVIYDFIEDEVLKSLDLLSEESTMEYYGRFNRWAALSLLARLYLNAEIYVGTARWQECIQACDEIINSDRYMLEEDYSLPFITHNEGSPEIIFAIPYSDENNGDKGWMHLAAKSLHPQNAQTYNFDYPDDCWGGNCALPQWIDTYHENDKRLEKSWIMGQQFSASGDTLYCSLEDDHYGRPLAYVNNLSSLYLSLQDEGYRLGKFEYEHGSKNHALENDFPLFRYADILMMKAECLLRLGQADDAAALVTQVRMRNFDDPADAMVTGTELQGGSVYRYGLHVNGEFAGPEEGGEDIQFGRMLDELGWEFVQEARRRTDLIRFGVFTTKSWFEHSPNGDHRTIFAIPQDIIDRNGYTQNPGY